MPSDAWVTYGIVYWPDGLKIVVYFIGLIWSFLAVGIIADVFMAAIEVITSAEKIVNRPADTTATKTDRGAFIIGFESRRRKTAILMFKTKR